MPFPLSISDIWKAFEWANNRKAANKEAVCKWLDAVYTDLEDLSKVWMKICEALETAKEQRQIDKALKIIRRGYDGYSQSVFAGRLRDFYDSASRVLGSSRRTADFRDDFIYKLGNILLERQDARQILDKELPQQEFAIESEAPETLVKMRELAEAIQKEVVSLQVMIRTFKAQA